MTPAATLNTTDIFPSHSDIEGLAVDGFPDREAFFQRVLREIDNPDQSLIMHLNVHGANIAANHLPLYDAFQQASVLFCDGAGIVLASKLLGNPLPCRLTGADYFLALIQFLADQGKTIYFLGGEESVSEKARAFLDATIPNHSIIGFHHGYILNNPTLEDTVIAEINRLKPDLLFVGFGMPLQETWTVKNAGRLPNVNCIFTIGAVLDYFTDKVPRCPAWMGQYGMEWLFRFLVEPKRLFTRYIVGNPQFLSRIALLCIKNKLSGTPQTAGET